jgi:hypothetical protein
MALFDDKFALLQAQLTAALDVIAAHPDIAAEVKTAVDAAQPPSDVAQGQAQDDARANVIDNLINDFSSALE